LGLTFACSADVSTARLLAGLLSGRFMKIENPLFPHPFCHCARILAPLPFPLGSGHPLPSRHCSLPLPAIAPPSLSSWRSLLSTAGWCGVVAESDGGAQQSVRSSGGEIQDGCDLCICGVWMMIFVSCICAVVYVWMMDVTWIWLEPFGVLEFLDLCIGLPGQCRHTGSLG